MREPDGRRLVESSTKDNVKWAKTTRWEELKVSAVAVVSSGHAVDVAPTIQLYLSLLYQDTVTYHAQLAGLLQAPSQFMVS
jgi:hypothetical protein